MATMADSSAMQEATVPSLEPYLVEPGLSDLTKIEFHVK